jgi:hypothetical protein
MNLEMSIGFEAFAIAVSVWASIDYNRFIKFLRARQESIGLTVGDISLLTTVDGHLRC